MGVPADFGWVFLLPWVLAVLALALVGAAAVAWRREWWSHWLRIHYSLVGLAALAGCATTRSQMMQADAGPASWPVGVYDLTGRVSFTQGGTTLSRPPFLRVWRRNVLLHQGRREHHRLRDQRHGHGAAAHDA